MGDYKGHPFRGNKYNGNQYRYLPKVTKKEILISHKGGVCEMCSLKYDGTNARIFAFHHTNPDEKDFQIGRGAPSDMDELLKELNKCNMLCKKCHRLVHTKHYKHIFPKILHV